MARTAAVVGTANAVSHRQAEKYAAQDAQKAQQYYQEQPQAAPAPVSTSDQFAELEKLGQLKDQGILTQEEFDAKKKQILGL